MKKFSRDADDLLRFSVGTDDDYEEEDNRHKNNDNHDRERNDHNNRNDRDNRNQNFQNNQQQQNKQWNNPLCKLLNGNKVYDRDDCLDILLKKDGLNILLKDLKKAAKNNDPNCAAYAQRLVRDIVFASAIPEALEDLCGKNYDENDTISKKDLSYLMNEFLIFVNNSYGKNITQMYDEECLSSMRNSYTNILYKYNKKKVKKLMEEIKNISKTTAKQICIITASGNPASSIYQLIKYLYREAGSEDMFNISVKNLTKLFKVCYGKDSMNKVVKYIMLERAQDLTNASEAMIDVSVKLDIVIREYLESLGKNDITNIIKEYIGDRKRQEKNGVIPRRFGDRRTIHPDDYPKLNKSLEDIEQKDFSVIQYLRK